MNSAMGKLKAWRTNPVQFVREAFGAEPDAWQADVLMAFPKEQRIAMKACKGPGKSTVEAWLAWNFLATRPHPKIAATSISADNLRDGLWTEMAKWKAKSPFLDETFEWTKERIFSKEFPETWWMSARSWAKSASREQQADTLSGLHADHLLFVIDEAGGVPGGVMAAAEAGLSTGRECKLILAGNPTHLEGPLYDACNRDRGNWFVVEITGDPDDPKRSPRISEQWAREQIEKYGRENPWVLVNVFGKFPPTSLNSLLGPEEVREAMNRNPKPDTFSWAQKRLGIDVARFGDDRTVIFPRQGLVAFPPHVMRGARTTDIAAKVATAIAQWGAEMEFVDDTGHWGHGVIDNLIAADYSPVGIQFHGPASDPRYRNKRAEMWMNMADWVKRGGSLPPIPELVGELTSPTYFFNQGKLQLEDKDQIKARIGRSPDLADALALTFSMPDQPGKTDKEKLFEQMGMCEQRPVFSRYECNPLDDAPSSFVPGMSVFDYDPLA